MSNQVHINNMPELPFAIEEAINRLRINVGFSSSDVKKIIVISTFPNEGKSFITIHLWYQMASMGTPSMLLDLDLRNSQMAEKYQIKTDDGAELRGTSHYLSGDYSLDDAIYHTDIEGGDILPNTNNVVNSAMMIESQKCRSMLDELAKRYRYVFVDAPPLDLVSDGERLGSICDGALLVVRSGSTSKHVVHNSIRQLERAGCPLLGIVLNRAEGGKGGYGYGRYGRYGRYGYGRYGYGRYGYYGRYGGYGYYGYGYGYGYGDHSSEGKKSRRSRKSKKAEKSEKAKDTEKVKESEKVIDTEKVKDSETTKDTGIAKDTEKVKDTEKARESGKTKDTEKNEKSAF